MKRTLGALLLAASLPLFFFVPVAACMALFTGAWLTSTPQPRRDCPHCHGTGWVAGLSYLKPCKCRQR